MRRRLACHGSVRRRGLAVVLVLFVLAGPLTPVSSANHPVIVEGNCPRAGAAPSDLVTPFTCGDYDGDGRIGAAEDADGDQVFGTLAAALGATGANQNGRVTIVTSGVFVEPVLITAANGNVTLEAAPGVEANIDAIRVGNAAGQAALQALPGIVVNAPANRIVTLRNLVSRNWTDGVLVMGDSRVTIDQVRVEHNVNFGIHVVDNARVSVTNSKVTGSGFRANPNANNTPNPGTGISYEGAASGTVAFTTVTGSAAAGIANETGNRNAVDLFQVLLFDNLYALRGQFQNAVGRSLIGG